MFDLAGTTVEDRGEVPAAFAAALARHDVAVSAEQLAAVRGASKREAIAALVPAGAGHAERSAAAFRDFQRELSRRYAQSARAAPSAERIFSSLRSHRILIALNTGFDRETTALLLGALGWCDKIADAIVCGDDVARGRPEPLLIARAMAVTGVADPLAVANVGDTTLDLEAGNRARVRWNVGVTSGAHDRARMQRAPHTHLIEELGDLRHLWQL